MKTRQANRFWLAFTSLALAALACQQVTGGPVTTPTAVQTGPTEPASTGGPASRSHLVSATVQVLMQVEEGNQYESFSWGSGTIISPTGMILTNAHVASPASQGQPQYEPDRLVIALVESEDKPPVPAYIATVEAVDGYLDLAVLQIRSTVDGGAVDTANLNLPFVELGNPDQIRLGDHLNIYGFPSIGGDTITYTDGNVSGFASDDQIGDRAWIKTDATVSGGNSGGLAADDSGRIIGVPTSLGASGSGMDCRPQQDTNGDGRVDNADFCVPISNFIADVRPINFAEPLIEAAQAGRAYASPYDLPHAGTQPGSGQETATDFGWLSTANSTAEGCKWSEDPVDAYPASALCIAAVFEYSGMTDGQSVRELWYLDDKPVSDYPYAWEWGPEGRFATTLSNSGEPMPAGEYYLEMYAGESGRLLGTSGRVVVGGGGDDQPSQPSAEDTITIYGTVYDVDTNKPVSAYVYVLLPGITFQQWRDQNFPESSLAASLQTGSSGQYEITGIPRNTLFTIVFVAEGYNIYYEDNIQANEETPQRVKVDIGLTK